MNEQEIKALREAQVVKSNELIQKSRHNLTPLQFDLLTFVMTQIHTFDRAGQRYKLYIKDFCEVVGIDSRSGAYTRVKKALDAIDKITVWIPKGNKEVRIRWFNILQMEEGSGEITLSFHEEIEPHLIGLTKNFTKYEAEQSYALKSCKYSKYLFDFLVSNLNRGEITISLEDFNKYVCPNNYKEYRDINKWILQPALAEINNITDITANYEPLKKNSRKTTHLHFSIKAVKGFAEKLIRQNNRTLVLDKEAAEYLAGGGEPDELPY